MSDVSPGHFSLNSVSPPTFLFLSIMPFLVQAGWRVSTDLLGRSPALSAEAMYQLPPSGLMLESSQWKVLIGRGTGVLRRRALRRA